MSNILKKVADNINNSKALNIRTNKNSLFKPNMNEADKMRRYRGEVIPAEGGVFELIEKIPVVVNVFAYPKKIHASSSGKPENLFFKQEQLKNDVIEKIMIKIKIM